MKRIQLCFLLFTAAFLTGCPSGPSKNLDRKDGLVTSINNKLVSYQTNYNNAILSNPAEAQRQRNDAIEIAVAVIDDNYTDYIRNLETRRARNDFIADVILEYRPKAKSRVAKKVNYIH
jgi:hypothetical protein